MNSHTNDYVAWLCVCVSCACVCLSIDVLVRVLFIYFHPTFTPIRCSKSGAQPGWPYLPIKDVYISPSLSPSRKPWRLLICEVNMDTKESAGWDIASSKKHRKTALGIIVWRARRGFLFDHLNRAHVSGWLVHADVYVDFMRNLCHQY